MSGTSQTARSFKLELDALGGLEQSQVPSGTPEQVEPLVELFAEAAADAPKVFRVRPFGGKTLPMPVPISSDSDEEQDTSTPLWDCVANDAAAGGVPNVPYFLQLYGYDDEETVKHLRGIATGIYASRIAPVKIHLKKLKTNE